MTNETVTGAFMPLVAIFADAVLPPHFATTTPCPSPTPLASPNFETASSFGVEVVNTASSVTSRVAPSRNVAVTSRCCTASVPLKLATAGVIASPTTCAFPLFFGAVLAAVAADFGTRGGAAHAFKPIRAQADIVEIAAAKAFLMFMAESGAMRTKAWQIVAGIRYCILFDNGGQGMLQSSAGCCSGRN